MRRLGALVPAGHPPIEPALARKASSFLTNPRARLDNLADGQSWEDAR